MTFVDTWHPASYALIIPYMVESDRWSFARRCHWTCGRDHGPRLSTFGPETWVFRLQDDSTQAAEMLEKDSH